MTHRDPLGQRRNSQRTGPSQLRSWRLDGQTRPWALPTSPGGRISTKGGAGARDAPGASGHEAQARGWPVRERGVLSAGDGPTRSPLWSRILRGGSGGTWGACDSSRPLSGLPAQTQTYPRPHHFLLALTTTTGKKPSDARTPDGVPTPPGHGERGGSGRHPERPAHHPSQAKARRRGATKAACGSGTPRTRTQARPLRPWPRAGAFVTG